ERLPVGAVELGGHGAAGVVDATQGRVPAVVLAREPYDVGVVALEDDAVAIVLDPSVVEEDDQRSAVRTVSGLRGQTGQGVPPVAGDQLGHVRAEAAAGAGTPAVGSRVTDGDADDGMAGKRD